MISKLVLVRHGESQWNKTGRFTGWTDVALTDRGIQEAHRAGQILRAEGFTFDQAHTSVLKRAIRTLWIVLEELDLMWMPVSRSWRLNERHYGALQGLYKKETALVFGESQVHEWRRSFAGQPPALTKDDERHPRFDPRYSSLAPGELPSTESLQDTLARVLPYWYEVLAPAIKHEQKVLVSAHGNSLRALVKFLDQIPDDEIPNLNIPTGYPLVYELDDNLKPIRHYYLGDAEEIKKATAAVKKQATTK